MITTKDTLSVRFYRGNERSPIHTQEGMTKEEFEEVLLELTSKYPGQQILAYDYIQGHIATQMKISAAR